MRRQSSSGNSCSSNVEPELVAEDLRVSKKIKKEVMPCQVSQTADINVSANFVNDKYNVLAIEDKNERGLASVLCSACDKAENCSFGGKYIAEESLISSPQCTKLNSSFYHVPCRELAQNLLGKILVRSLENGVVLKGRIVETECYLGGEDKASHSYNGKITPRNKPMYMKPGTTYVYFTYGMYFCFNISSEGDGAAVLIRAVDPIEGHDHMNSWRINKRMNSKRNLKLGNSVKNTNSSAIKPHELCNGPGKLCISFCIDEKSCNMQDLCTWEGMWIESDSESEKVNCSDFITSTRIGIDSVEAEWALKPLRYYIHGNRSVSKRDRKKELERLNLIK